MVLAPASVCARVCLKYLTSATVGVVGVRTPPKNQVGVSDAPKKVKGEHRTSRDV